MASNIFTPIRTDSPDLSRVQDLIRQSSAATNQAVSEVAKAVKVPTRTVTVAGNYRILGTDQVVFVTQVPSSDGTVYLPDAILLQGRTIQVKHVSDVSGTPNLFVKPIASGGRLQTIDGTGSALVALSTTLAVISDGSNWTSV